MYMFVVLKGPRVGATPIMLSLYLAVSIQPLTCQDISGRFGSIVRFVKREAFKMRSQSPGMHPTTTYLRSLFLPYRHLQGGS